LYRNGKIRTHAWILPIAFPSIEKIFCFSNNASFDDIVDDKIVKSSYWREALRQAEVIVTTTSACNPYIYAEDINSNQLIINISLMDFALDVFQKASIIVDDWFQCTQAQKVFKIKVFLKERISSNCQIFYLEKAKIGPSKKIIQ
jgi:ornithine cyclodeaminase/alanine dehydrogenase-like protein (mu-crystallin family)